MLDILLARREFTGWHMLAVMIALFGTVIGVNVTMAVFAMSTWSGLVVENSYVASQHFNTEVADRRRQAALGYRLEASYANETVTIAMTRAGSPLTIQSVQGRVGRPVTAMEDAPLAFRIGEKGAATAKIQLAAGRWKADVAVTSADGERMQRGLRFTVSDAESQAGQ